MMRGYHRVDTVMTTLDISDTIAIAPSDRLMVKTVPEADFPPGEQHGVQGRRGDG